MVPPAQHDSDRPPMTASTIGSRRGTNLTVGSVKHDCP